MSKAGSDPFSASPEEQTQKQIFIATFSMLSKLASADGKVGKNEVQIIDRFMKGVLELDSERRAFAINVFNQARREKVDFEEYAKRYGELLSDKPKMLEWMVDVLLRISYADECFSDPEEKIVKSACKIFGISDSRYAELRAKYMKGEPATTEPVEAPKQESQASGNSPYAVLSISPDATDQEIIEKHKKLSVEYSPSRIIEFGLPHEFVELAERKFREIQEAFKSLKAERGF